MTEPQVIRADNGSPAFAVIPWRDDERLVRADAAALPSDQELYDRAKAAGGASLPIEVADRPLAGENPIKVYRRNVGLTQKALAAEAVINPVYLSQIERGKRTGSARTLARIAKALGVDVDAPI